MDGFTLYVEPEKLGRLMRVPAYIRVLGNRPIFAVRDRVGIQSGGGKLGPLPPPAICIDSSGPSPGGQGSSGSGVASVILAATSPEPLAASSRSPGSSAFARRGALLFELSLVRR